MNSNTCNTTKTDTSEPDNTNLPHLTPKEKFAVFLADKNEQELYLDRSKRCWNYAVDKAGLAREIADQMIQEHSLVVQKLITYQKYTKHIEPHVSM